MGQGQLATGDLQLATYNGQLQLQLKTLPKCNVSHMQHESELKTETKQE